MLSFVLISALVWPSIAEQVGNPLQEATAAPDPGLRLAAPAQWTAWTASPCTKTCGGGTRTLERTCIGTPPGTCTPGVKEIKTQTCNMLPCLCLPNGQWGRWGAWTTCSALCGSGVQTHTRSCNATCSGGVCNPGQTQTQSQTCTGPLVPAYWSAWAASTCSKPCGGGSRVLQRECEGTCQGACVLTTRQVQTQACNIQPCPCVPDGHWLTWGSWSSCSSFCGAGRQSQTRSCKATCPGGVCNPGQTEVLWQPCTGPGVPAEWTEWTAVSACSASCGAGVRQESRRCRGSCQNTVCAPGQAQTRTATCITQCPTDRCGQAPKISGEGRFAFSTIGATTDGPNHPPCAHTAGAYNDLGATFNDVWFDYVATCSGPVTFSTCHDANYDTDLVVYPSCACPTATTSPYLACRDDTPGCTLFTSWVRPSLSINQCYKVRIGGFRPDSYGVGNLTIRCGGGGGIAAGAERSSETANKRSAPSPAAAAISGGPAPTTLPSSSSAAPSLYWGLAALVAVLIVVACMGVMFGAYICAMRIAAQRRATGSKQESSDVSQPMEIVSMPETTTSGARGSHDILLPGQQQLTLPHVV